MGAGAASCGGSNVSLSRVLSAPCFQVSRFLVVRPENRYTAEEALAHPFFQQYVVEEVRHFSPAGKFKVRSPGLPVPISGWPGIPLQMGYREGGGCLVASRGACGAWEPEGLNASPPDAQGKPCPRLCPGL